MIKKSLLCSLLTASLLSASLCADAKQENKPQIKGGSCGKSHKPMRVEARHIEANGIGYNQGYTTLDGFFSPFEPWDSDWVPFVDLRGHVFNNGKFAANAGIGARYIDRSWVWGINAYYDYRQTKRHDNYNQISLGLEALGHIWDFRINGYLPIGQTQSHFYDQDFHAFSGNSMIISRKREVAMRGFNAEAGLHVDRFKKVPLYFAAGPYYLEGEGRVAWGGQLRAMVNFLDYFRIEGNTSYDKVFHWIGQGQVSVIIPFGRKREVKQRKARSCTTALALAERALQRVDRFEIIPITHKRKKSEAINPATGQPYVFWFVNNTSSSQGTYESPFPTLAQAEAASNPGDIIYVFPGDGTTTGMNLGIILQNNQQLLGSGIAQNIQTTKGNIQIPALTNALPQITNITVPGSTLPTMVGAGVTLANGNTVSGIFINQTQGSGIVGWGISNATLINNFILNTNQHDIDDGSGINLISSSASSSGFLTGTFLIQGNTIQAIDPIGENMKGVLIDVGISGNLGSTDMCSISILNNSIPTAGSNGVEITTQGATTVTLDVSNNAINRFSTTGTNRGFVLASKDNSILTFNVAGNSISSDGAGSPLPFEFRGPGFLYNQQASAPSSGTITGNTFFNSSVGARIGVSGGKVTTIVLNNNTFYGNQAESGSSSFDFDVQVTEPGLANLSISNNSAPQWGYFIEVEPVTFPAVNQFIYESISSFNNNVGQLKISVVD